MTTSTGRRTEHRGKVYKELDYWYDQECQQKKKTQVALKEYKYRNDDEYTERYWECRKKYEKL